MSLQVEDQLADTLREMFNVPAAQLTFMADAWEQIVECRRMLKWTFAYGYYLEGTQETTLQRRELFEFLQVGRLSYIVEVKTGFGCLTVCILTVVLSPRFIRLLS